MELKPGTYSQLTSILMESHSIWGKGFAKDDYLKFNLRLRKRPWSKYHFRHLVLLDRVRRPICSCKVYEMNALVKSKPVRLAQLSSLFTPAQRRKHGFADELMKRLMSRLKEEGFSLAVLFSEISPDFFKRYGFREIEKYDLLFDLVIPAEPKRKVTVVRHKVPERVRSLYRKNRSPLFRTPITGTCSATRRPCSTVFSGTWARNHFTFARTARLMHGHYGQVRGWRSKTRPTATPMPWPTSSPTYYKFMDRGFFAKLSAGFPLTSRACLSSSPHNTWSEKPMCSWLPTLQAVEKVP